MPGCPVVMVSWWAGMILCFSSWSLGITIDSSFRMRPSSCFQHKPSFIDASLSAFCTFLLILAVLFHASWMKMSSKVLMVILLRLQWWSLFSSHFVSNWSWLAFILWIGVGEGAPALCCHLLLPLYGLVISTRCLLGSLLTLFCTWVWSRTESSMAHLTCQQFRSHFVMNHCRLQWSMWILMGHLIT